MPHEDEKTRWFTGQIDSDCGTVYLFTGKLNEDEFMNLMDFMDDMEPIKIKFFKVDT